VTGWLRENEEGKQKKKRLDWSEAYYVQSYTKEKKRKEKKINERDGGGRVSRWCVVVWRKDKKKNMKMKGKSSVEKDERNWVNLGDKDELWRMRWNLGMGKKFIYLFILNFKRV
jgi:hypothetical protein